MSEKLKLCDICHVPIEELCVVATDWDPSGKYTSNGALSFMLYGGEIRYYSFFECPNCEKLTIFRIKDEKR